MTDNILGKFDLTRIQMVPPFGKSRNLPIISTSDAKLVEQIIYKEKSKWNELIQKGNYKLTADSKKFAFLYESLIYKLSDYLSCNVKLKTPLDFFLFDKFDKEWEDKPSGFIHNDWGNYSICMKEFAKKEDIAHYDPSNAIALVLAISLPEKGSGIELYDAFHGEKGVSGKTLLQQRATQSYSLRKYDIGSATLFCPFQYHSGHCAEKGTLETTDSRFVLVAFLVKYRKEAEEEWHMFRMCKGATLEYGDESLYGLHDDILAS
jgi:hypothetical protein